MSDIRSQASKFASSQVPSSEPSNLSTCEPANPSLCIVHSALSIDSARTLVVSPLWPRIRAFLWQFETLCDESRIRSKVLMFECPHVPDSEPANLRTCELANALAATLRVAASALRALGVEATFHPFPSDDGSRLLLLSREDYDRLAQFLGAIALAPALRRITSGAEVRALKAALPGIYPEALAYAAYFRRFEALFSSLSGGSAPRPLQEAVPAAGHALLALALSSLPSELLLRQRLRFPEGSPADTALAECSHIPSSEPANLRTGEPANGEGAAAKDAATLALKLSNPSEYHTLCS